MPTAGLQHATHSIESNAPSTHDARCSATAEVKPGCMLTLSAALLRRAGRAYCATPARPCARRAHPRGRGAPARAGRCTHRRRRACGAGPCRRRAAWCAACRVQCGDACGCDTWRQLDTLGTLGHACYGSTRYCCATFDHRATKATVPLWSMSCRCVRRACMWRCAHTAACIAALMLPFAAHWAWHAVGCWCSVAAARYRRLRLRRPHAPHAAHARAGAAPSPARRQRRMCTDPRVRTRHARAAERCR